MTRIELIADLRSASPDVASRLVRLWAADDAGADLVAAAMVALSSEAAAACGPLPPGWRLHIDETGSGFWSASLSAAGRTRRPAVVLMAPVHPGYEAVGAMLALLESDSTYGAVAARLQCRDGCCVQSLPRIGDRAPEWIPLAAMADSSPHELLDDLLAPCLVVKPLLLTDFGEADPPFESLAGAVVHRLMAARRSGFRTALANRAMVRVAGTECTVAPGAAVTLPPVDAARLQTLGAESGHAPDGSCEPCSERLETLTSRLLKVVRGRARPSLLLDMRSVQANVDGHALAAIGAATGLHRAAGDWDVSVLADPAGTAFHHFDASFPGWTIFTSQPSSIFTIALRLSQPSRIQDMVELHQAARINAYLLLDAMAGEALNPEPHHRRGTWRFLAASADGLLFISECARQRFGRGFAAADCPTAVCRLSFDPDEYTRRELIGAPQRDHLLVVGNHFADGDVAATAGALASAFPFERIEVLGPSPVRSSRVTAHTSGNLTDLVVHRLYASARMVLFPSFHEEFGFPVVTALSYGRTLFARASPLLDELAAQGPRSGHLHVFQQRDDVVEAIGRMLHGEPVAEIPLGERRSGGAPRSWQHMGLEIDRFLRTLIAGASSASWRTRDELVSEALACRP